MQLNRETRRALKRAERTVSSPARQSTKVIPVNPLFALDATARNKLATTERKAFDAILAHQATPDNIGEIETLIEASIRAIKITQREKLPHLDASGLDAALQRFYRAAWSIRHAKARHAETGVYGLDAADRAALIEVDELVGEMRKPGVILRKTWLAAFRESYAGKGVLIPALEEVAA
jgi:hypothetical protein